MTAASVPLAAVAQVVLRKYGCVLSKTVNFDEVARRVPDDYSTAPPAKLVVATAPCEELTRLGLSAVARESDGLELESAEFPHFILELPRFTLRRREIAPGMTIGPVRGEEEFLPFAGHKISWLAIADLPKGWEPFLWVQDGAQRHIVGARNNQVIVIGIDLFEYLSHSLSWPAVSSGISRRVDQGNFAVAEILIRRLLMDAIRMAGAAFAVIDPWPNGKRWAFSVRHDYDRVITDAEIHRILERYVAENVRSSWYILTHKRITHQIKMVAAAGHEIGLHTTAESAKEFAAQISALKISSQQPVTGVTAHGGDYIGFLGGNQVNWALDNDLFYSETQCYPQTRPYQLLAGNDRVGYGLSSHFSLDLGTHPDKHALDRCVAAAGRARTSGNGFLLMNHPDIHIAQVFAFLDAVPREDAWSATSSEMASWAALNARCDIDISNAKAELTLPFPSPWAFNVELPGPGTSARIKVAPGDSTIRGAF